MKQIITIQHTQSVHHTNGMIGSWTDWDLSALGVAQAERIGANLARELDGQAYQMISSDLLRAKRTAGIVAGHLGIPVRLDPRLREGNLGEAVGKSVEWAHANTVTWQKTVDDRPFRGAETKRDVWNRLQPLLDALLASEQERYLLVSHGGTLSIFYAMWLGLEVEALNRCDLARMAGGVSFLQETDDQTRVIRRLNDTSYMK